MRPVFEDAGIEENRTFNTKEAVRHVLEKWTNHFDLKPKEINGGDCEVFASAVKTARCHTGMSHPLEIVGCEFGGYEVFHDKWGGHVWIYDHETGLHHDAERPEGTEDWKSLPVYNRNQNQYAK